MPSRTLLAGAYTALILMAILAPAHLLGRAEESHAGPRLIPHADKIIHAAIFFGFAGAWTWAGPPRDRVRMIRVLAVGLILAVATELAQGLPFIGRDPGTLDALADALGLGLGLGVAWLLGVGVPPR